MKISSGINFSVVSGFQPSMTPMKANKINKNIAITHIPPITYKKS
jgi:hypothetical protein